MHHVRQENLPFVGSSHEFVGAEQGHTSVSVFLFHGKAVPARVRIGTLMTRSCSFVRAVEAWTVNRKTFEGTSPPLFRAQTGVFPNVDARVLCIAVNFLTLFLREVEILHCV